MFLKKNERLNGSRSITLALELTRKMAEILSGTKLTLVEFSVDAAKITGSRFAKPYGFRVVKTDCEFVDDEQKKYVAIAWVSISRHEERWIPQYDKLFIKLNERLPIRMVYTVPTTTFPLPDPIVEKHFEPWMVDYNPAELDYSRIR